VPTNSTKILYYSDQKGSIPVKEFIDHLSDKQKTKILRLFLTIENYGLSSIIPHTKKLIGTPLWEIRILGKDNIRIMYVSQQTESIVILHGFIKKDQKTPTKELNIALQRYYQLFDK